MCVLLPYIISGPDPFTTVSRAIDEPDDVTVGFVIGNFLVIHMYT